MKIFVLCGVLCFASAEFFHESSGVELKPSGGYNNSDFGSAIAYQGSKPPRLVVGAPKEDYVGMVYNCPLSDLSTEINCSKIDMTSLNLENKTAAARAYINPKQNYYFGSSLAATSEYFFTCAPMLPRKLRLLKTVKFRKASGKLGHKTIPDFVTDTYGGCYVHDNTTYTEWIDNAVRFEDTFVKPSKYIPVLRITDPETFAAGALGSSTLAEDDGFVMAAKSSFVGDILYVDSARPKDVTKSLIDQFYDEFHVELNHLYNLGYGLAAGYFFDKSTKLYAVSARVDLNGEILFLKKNDITQSYLEIFRTDDNSFIYIENESLSSMFGYAMAALDMNADGLSELLVGAPAESDDGKQELGALHIYVGGDLQSRNDKKRMRTVLADEKAGRFGSAIAISDIDSDGISEIIVSSPYEEFGVVYVISGYELNQVFFRESGFKVVKLSELKLTQRLRGDSGSRLFGFSLQVVKDVDGNGCDELAIGSPGSSAVRVVRCLPAVNTSLTLELKGEQIVDVVDTNFTVSVCLNVTLSSSCASAIGTIEVECSATGKVNIKDPIFKYNITMDSVEPQYCKDIRVDFNETSAVADYQFSSKLSLLKDDSSNTSDYKSWAVLSPYSEKEKSILVQRLCKRDCESNLQYQWVWSGNEAIDTSEPMNETLTFTLTNNGTHAAHRVVLDLKVIGAFVILGDCVKNGLDAYACELEKKLDKDVPYTMVVRIYVTEHTNVPGYLELSASLYDAVFPNKIYTGEPLHKKFALDANEVRANGSINSFEVTDKDLEDDEIIVYRDIYHDYVILNDGAVTWYGLNAVITVKNESYIENVKIVSTEDCSQQNILNDNEFQFSCKFTLKPNTSATIAANIEVSKKILENALDKGESNIRLNSKMAVRLFPLEEIRVAKASTYIHYNQILTTGNKKWLIVLIVVLVATFILLLIMFGLYKYGFFKRTQKRKLSEARESIRRRSVRMASQSSRSVRPSFADGDMGICEMEVVDDCAFHDVEVESRDSRTSDDNVLVH